MGKCPNKLSASLIKNINKLEFAQGKQNLTAASLKDKLQSYFKSSPMCLPVVS